MKKLLFCSASRRHSLDTPADNIFNVDNSFTAKPLPKCNNLSAIVANSSVAVDGLKYREKSLQNFIVNKLYNELSTENNNSQLLALSKPFTCNHSCKCRVEIIPHDDADAEPKAKCTIKIVECDCQSYDVATNESTKVLFAENRGYGVTMPTQSCTKMPGEPVEHLENYEPEHEAKVTKTRILTSIDLLNFARQIASGMVLTHAFDVQIIIFFILSKCDFAHRSFWPTIKSCIVTWPPGMCWSARIKPLKLPISVSAGTFTKTIFIRNRVPDVCR